MHKHAHVTSWRSKDLQMMQNECNNVIAAGYFSAYATHKHTACYYQSQGRRFLFEQKHSWRAGERWTKAVISRFVTRAKWLKVLVGSYHSSTQLIYLRAQEVALPFLIISIKALLQSSESRRSSRPNSK